MRGLLVLLALALSGACAAAPVDKRLPAGCYEPQLGPDAAALRVALAQSRRLCSAVQGRGQPVRLELSFETGAVSVAPGEPNAYRRMGAD